MAGLFENDTYTIITTSANELVGKVHNRMPVILRREDEEAWADNHNFDAVKLIKLLKPYSDRSENVEEIVGKITGRI